MEHGKINCGHSSLFGVQPMHGLGHPHSDQAERDMLQKQAQSPTWVANGSHHIDLWESLHKCDEFQRFSKAFHDYK